MNLQGPNKKSFPPWNPKKSSSSSSNTSTFYANSSSTNTPKTTRFSTLNIRHSNSLAHIPSDPKIAAHCEIEYIEEDCAITAERLKLAHDAHAFQRRESCLLTSGEKQMLQNEQKTLRKSLFLDSAVVGSMRAAGSANKAMGGSLKAGGNFVSKGMAGLTGGMTKMGMNVKDQMQSALKLVDEDEEDDDEDGASNEDLSASGKAPPQSQESNYTKPKDQVGRGTLKAQFMTAKLRARLDDTNDGVLGVQSTGRRIDRFNSMRGNNYMMYNMNNIMSQRGGFGSVNSVAEDEEDTGEEEKKEVDLEDISYVRKPNLARIIEEYEAMQNHPKYNLKQIVLSRRFHLYAHRFGNAQYQHTLVYPTLRQPNELYSCPWLCRPCEEEPVTEKTRTRTKGHRFIIAADTQFGILMDGFAMDFPNWSQEIEISRKCVKQINAMTGDDRPLFVCMCGDLVDTESSFSGAIASWKKIMSGWERNLVFEQQVKDFKRIWAGLDPDIALVCLCGNHDVGNRPTRASINHWTSVFGDDFLSFWVNGTFNICLNNCLFSNPSGAPDLYEEQLQWLEDQLKYGRENDATHIFVYGHFPWFLKHEEEADDFLTSYSAAPAGWGPPGSSFADSYFTIPLEQRKVAMALFKKYNVTGCFSGHFHQNVVAQTSWGMPMIVTGPLSMNLNSEISHELAQGEVNGIGMRVVDVGGRGEFKHKWLLLDDESELYEHAVERCLRQTDIDEEERRLIKNSLFEMPDEMLDVLNEEESGEEEKEDIDVARVRFDEEGKEGLDNSDVDRVHLTLTPQESKRWFSSMNLNVDSDSSDSDSDDD